MSIHLDGVLQLGENFNLTCTIVGAEDLHPVTTYHWTKNGDTNIQAIKLNGSSILSFHPLNYSDAGLYTCQVGINSTYLIKNLTVDDSRNITIQSKPQSHRITKFCVADQYVMK